MNYNELTDELSQLYKNIKAGKVDPTVAHELNNTAANIQSVVRLGLLNAKLQGRTPDLKFFKAAARKAAKTGSKGGARG